MKAYGVYAIRTTCSHKLTRKQAQTKSPSGGPLVTYLFTRVNVTQNRSENMHFNAFSCSSGHKHSI